MIVPWVTQWSGEREKWTGICAHTGLPSLFINECRGIGEPLWKRMHPVRQRLAVATDLCQVCGGFIGSGFYQRISLAERECDEFVDPFVHRACAVLAMKACPELCRHLSRDNLVVRVVTRWEWRPVFSDEQAEIVEGLEVIVTESEEITAKWISSLASS